MLTKVSYATFIVKWTLVSVDRVYTSLHAAVGFNNNSFAGVVGTKSDTRV